MLVLLFSSLCFLGTAFQLVLPCIRSQRVGKAAVLSISESDCVTLLSYARMVTFFGVFGLIWQYGGVEVLLCVFTLGVTLLAVLDKILFEPKRGRCESTLEFLNFSRDVWVLVLFIFIVSNFVVQRYRVPTGSLEPTVHPGDFLLVNQFAYGWHLPIINTPIGTWGKPKTGDIAVFRYPNDPYKIIYVKRVVGVPGDRVQYRNKQLTINGQQVQQDYVGLHKQEANQVHAERYLSERKEYLPNATHNILVNDLQGLYENIDVVVPEGTYFVMGDNRDNSQDSRFFGPVPERLLVGKAIVVLFGWEGYWPSFKRLGLWL